jgi:hypothetical protein
MVVVVALHMWLEFLPGFLGVADDLVLVHCWWFVCSYSKERKKDFAPALARAPWATDIFACLFFNQSPHHMPERVLPTAGAASTEGNRSASRSTD